MERLEARQLLAFNIVDDAFSLSSDASLNVLGNDTAGSEVQTVSAKNVEVDKATANRGSNTADNFIPERPGQPGVPQRSVFPGAVTLWRPQQNYGDIRVYVDTDNDPSNDNIQELLQRVNVVDGMLIGTLRDNSPLNAADDPPGDPANTNLAVVQYTWSNSTGDAWVATNASPENRGEQAADYGAAYFPYSAGWRGASFNGRDTMSPGGVAARIGGDAGIVAEGALGEYEVTVDGVEDSFNDGFLIGLGGDNVDNYTRTMPLGGNRWSVIHRDNANDLLGSDLSQTQQKFNVLYVPRSTQGLIGGVVKGSSSAVNPMRQSFGDFEIQRVSDGFWKLTVPGHDATSGVVLMENADTTNDRPRNTYFTYDADPDDPQSILIRQFDYNRPNADLVNEDFMFFFVPFENELAPTNPLSISQLGSTPATLGDNVSAQGISLGVNPDGTVNYQTGSAIRALGEGETATDSFVYEVEFTDGDGVLQTGTATVNVTWQGVNDEPEVIAQPGDLSFMANGPAIGLDLTDYFVDPDTNDTLSYEVSFADPDVVSGSIDGANLTVTPVPNSTGTTTMTVTATDLSGASVSVVSSVSVIGLQAVDDTFFVSGDTVLSVLNNDRTGAEVQNVTGINVVYNRDTVRSTGNNFAENTIPERPGQPGIPQRSLGVGAMTINPGQNNYADISLYFDLDDDYTNDGANTQRINKADGIALGTMMDNSPLGPGSHGPTEFRDNSNLAVVQYTSNNSGAAWIATNAAPENNGERAIDFSSAFFPYSAGWIGGSFNYQGNATSATRAGISWGGAGLTVTELSNGRFEVAVDGVQDSFNEGFLFAIGGDNSDNYTRTRPIGGNKWRVQHRDNAATLGGAESNSWNVVYIPRSAPGLVGGVVNGTSDVVNPMKQSFGDFEIKREEDGFWRLSVPGHSPSSGVLVMETMDLTVDQPRNSYFSYVAADNNPDDFIIRQFDYTRNPSTLNPQNGDFAFFFIPFENDIQSQTPITVTRVGSSLETLGNNVTSKGIPITVNADGTIDYDTDGAIRALGEGDTDVDTFVYEASFDGQLRTATATINWVGANDAPELVQSLGEVDLLEDGSTSIDLSNFFSDPDTGDSISYSVSLSRGDIVEATVDGNSLTIAGIEDKFGFVRATVTATDLLGASVSTELPISVLAQADGPVATDDVVSVLKSGVSSLDLLANDFHPDAGPYQVVGANIFGNPEAANDAETAWAIEQTGSGPNEMTMIGAQNRGDLAIGVAGEPATPMENVLLGTIRNDSDPFGSVNVWSWGTRGDALTFATELGAGGNDERNAPLGAALFPFAEGWVGGHVETDGTLTYGHGVNQSDITKVVTADGSTGLWTVSIPGVTDSNTDGFLFAIGGNNDDNFVTGLPLGGDTWLIRQMDNDSNDLGFEDDPFRFVYVPIDSPGLTAGRWATAAGTGGGEEEEQPGGVGSIDLSAGTFTATDNQSSGVIIDIPGVTPNDGALIVMPIGPQNVLLSDGSNVQIPTNLHGFVNTTADDKFEVALRQSNDFAIRPGSFQFIFVPFENNLRTGLSVNSDITVQSVDATSSLGAAVAVNPDGTFAYDPTGSAAIAALAPGESLEDTFSYTIVDGASRTSTATATVTVFGSNVPTAINLSGNEVIENTDTSSASLLVGTLSTELSFDNPAETFVYELFEGAGGTDNASFEIVDDQLFLNQGTTIDFETQPSYTVRVRVTSGAGETLERDLTVNVVDLLEVSSITVGDGSDQRSRVDQVVVEFDGEANVGANALVVEKLGDNAGPVDVAVSTELVGGRTVATLQFSGSRTEFGSLVDGNYRLRVDGALVSRPSGELLDANQNGTGGGELLFGDEAADNFFRLYGDADGDGDVDITDLNDHFIPAFGGLAGQPGYRADLDADNDGDVDITDLNDFFIPNFGALRPSL